MTRLALAYGGKSGEHEVSRVSAAAVAAALDPSEFRLIAIGIDYAGRWYLTPEAEVRAAIAGGTPLPVVQDERNRIALCPGIGLFAGNEGSFSRLEVDVAFPLVHGTNGEDGSMQGLFEQAGLPYIGVGVSGSAVGMDKELAKRLWANAGIPVVPYRVVRSTDDRARALAEVESALAYPVFVKPVCGGSSVGASKASDRGDLDTALDIALRFDERALVEPFLSVREIECSVIGLDEPRAFPPGEIVPTHEFYDYEAKYTDPDGAKFAIPAALPAASIEAIMSYAKRAYSTIGLDSFARVDFFLDKANGNVYLNEVNTIPGFTPISMFPKMCAAGGLPFDSLISELHRFAVERHARRSKLSFSKGNQ
jgi:D-alanine-D-alanine ligase